MLTWTQVLAVALLLSLLLHVWQVKLLADERQKTGYWKSKADGNDYWTQPNNFQTPTVPVDLDGITISERDVQP